MTFPKLELPYLPPNTILPKEGLEETFVQYLMRLYEEIAFNINARDYTYFTIPVTDVATDIPNLPNFGAFLICVSGTESGQPTGIWTACKSDSGAAGTLGATVPLCSQAGTGGTWGAINLAITVASATNFQIAHTLANTPGNFNIRIVGTQWGGGYG